MPVSSVPSVDISTFHQQIDRLNGILNVVIHLFPESSERFEYDEEILMLISVARDLAQDMQNQCYERTLYVSTGRPPPQGVTTGDV